MYLPHVESSFNYEAYSKFGAAGIWQFTHDTGRRYLMVGVAGLVLSVFGYFISREQFFYSYLTAFVFWFTIGLGGLLFVMIHYLTNATWSVVLRRIGENIMSVVPMMAIFAIPVILGAGSIYEVIRRHSMTAEACTGVISGLGFDSYCAALRYLAKLD